MPTSLRSKICIITGLEHYCLLGVHFWSSSLWHIIHYTTCWLVYSCNHFGDATLLHVRKASLIYKSKLVRLFESTSLCLLVIWLCWSVIHTVHWEYVQQNNCFADINGAAFIQFLLIILISAIKICYQNKYRRNGYNLIDQDSSDDGMVHERVNDLDIIDNTGMYYHIGNMVDTYWII